MKHSLAHLYTAAPLGIEASLIDVEVDTSPGLSSFTIVGLADKSVKESKERVASAIKNSGASPPNRQNRRVTVNLAPADVPKGGSGYDLAIAIAYLLSSKQMSYAAKERILLAGELGLDGSLRPIPGALAIAQCAQIHGFSSVILPTENAAEAALLEKIKVIPARSLSEVIDHLEDTYALAQQPKTNIAELHSQNPLVSIDDIVGQENAKRALEIVAAGAHNILLSGPPGTGKTMLAKTLPSLMPTLIEQEIVEVTQIYSAAGLTQRSLMVQRPFRAPHHTASPVSIIGGGSNPRPGEISLAHRGILFLDELPEFRSDVLEALREPLEESHITIARAKRTLRLPADFILFAAMNPCPCGHHGDDGRECTCSAQEINRYQKRISGPLLDRIDIHLTVPRVDPEKIVHRVAAKQEHAERQQRIQRARSLQKARLSSIGKLTNSQMSNRDLKKYAHISDAAQQLFKTALSKNLISMRGYYRLIRVARTIADLEEAPGIEQRHAAEALRFRARTEA